MHKSSYLRMEYLVKHYAPFFAADKERISVLEIGSCDAEGSYRKLFDNCHCSYTGLDMEHGPNVDVVPEDIYHWAEIEDESFDLVISGQVFEHIEYPWLTMEEIARVLKPSGFCVIIAPNSGREHKAPKDCYRYFADGLTALAKWAGLKVRHVSVAGVPGDENSGAWVSDWNDGCLVAQKEPAKEHLNEIPFEEERRVPTYGYADTYRVWEQSVRRVCRRFDAKKQIVLFGAGWIGEMVLEILGSGRVYCFIDNAPDRQGKLCRGKKIMALGDYIKEDGSYPCLITASYKASAEIKEELAQKGICGETLYEV